LDAKVVSLGGGTALKGATKAARAEKRVNYRDRIQKVLLVSSRLDSDSIYRRILAEIPDLEIKKIQQALSAMKQDEIANRDDNGGWYLTTKGREYKVRNSHL
jgi:hypothetical protein